VRYWHSRELAIWDEQQEVNHPITPPHSSWYHCIQTGGAPGSALGIVNGRTAFTQMFLSLLFCLNLGKEHVLYIRKKLLGTYRKAIYPFCVFG